MNKLYFNILQIKLFHDWFEHWTEDEKNQFMEKLGCQDNDFMTKLQKHINSNEEISNNLSLATTQINSNVEETSNTSDHDVTGPSSTPSSPLSSLPLSQSPHDSGMEETQSDLENISQNLESPISRSDVIKNIPSPKLSPQAPGSSTNESVSESKAEEENCDTKM